MNARLPFLHDIWQDLRLGFRAFAQMPAVSVLMVVALAVSIGATTAIFSVMNVLLLRPIAGVHDQIHLVSVERKEDQGIEAAFSYPENRDLRARVSSLDLAGFVRTAVDLGIAVAPWARVHAAGSCRRTASGDREREARRTTMAYLGRDGAGFLGPTVVTNPLQPSDLKTSSGLSEQTGSS